MITVNSFNLIFLSGGLMEKQLSTLVNILSEQVILHENLLNLLKEENLKIGIHSGSSLLRLHSDKLMLTRKIAYLEEQRILIIKNLAEMWQEEEKTLTLSWIIQKVSIEYKEPLKNSFNLLKKFMNEIKESAEHNARISKARLKSVDQSLRFLKDIHKSQKTYSYNGILKSGKTKLTRAAV